MATARTYDQNGWYEIKDNPISRIGIFEYLGKNVDPSFAPDQIVRVLRSEEELSRPETIDSFKLLPWIDEHVMLGPEETGLTAPEQKGIEGVTGENVYFDVASGKLRSNIKVFSNNLDDLIAAGKKELSLGYRCKYSIQSGMWNGQPYDAIQTNIRGNHLALVKEGRMGHDVAVLDHMTFTFDAKDLKMAELTKEEKERAEDKKALDEVREEVKKIGDSVKALDAKIMDKKGKDGLEDNEDPAIAADKRAKDEAEEKKKEEEKKAEDKKAMDAAIKSAMDSAIAPLLTQIETLKAGATKAMLSEVSRKNALASQLSTFGIALDSAEMTLPELQAAAVAKIGITCAAGTEQIALDGYFHNRAAPGTEIGYALDAANGGGNTVTKMQNYFKPAA